MQQDTISQAKLVEQDTLITSDSSAQLVQLATDSLGNDIETTSKAEVTKNEKFFSIKSLFDVALGAAQTVAETAQGTAKTVTDVTQGTTQAVIQAAQGTAKTVIDVTQGTTQAVIQAAQGTAKTVTDVTKDAAKATTDVGQNIAKVALDQNKNKLEAGQASKEALVTTHIKQVNLNEVEKAVKALQEKYPQETPTEIAFRLLSLQVIRTSLIAGAIGLVPGKVAESIGIEQTALTLIQAETIYQIAAVYGSNLHSTELRTEVFVIFDRALRASRMARMGLGFMQMIPFAGGVLNAGTDGYVLYIIGDTARSFFEYKSKETIAGETLKFFAQETQKQYQRLW